MVALRDRSFMTAEEYLLWESQQEVRHEYWDGEVIAMAGGTKRHNRAAGNVFKFLDNALVDRDCEVYISDIKVQVQANRKFFYPDVVVSCDERDRDGQIVNFPCLIIEVLSPSTELLDRGAKFSAYRRFSTLMEYVLVSLDAPIVEVFVKGLKGQWVMTEYGLNQVIELESIGVQLAVYEIFDRITFEEA